MKRLKATAATTGPGARFYSVAHTAGLFGMSEMTIYRAIAAGEFPAVRIRGRLFIPAKAIDEMEQAALASQTGVDAADWVPDADA